MGRKGQNTKAVKWYCPPLTFFKFRAKCKRMGVSMAAVMRAFMDEWSSLPDENDDTEPG